MSDDEQAEQGTPRTDALVSEYIAACAACESDDQEQWAALGEIWVDKLLAKHAALERELSAQRQPIGGEAGEVAAFVNKIHSYAMFCPLEEREMFRSAAVLIEKMAQDATELRNALATSLEWKMELDKVREWGNRWKETARKAGIEWDRAASELSALKARLDAPCEEVENVMYDTGLGDNQADWVVPADYARDLYRKWQEAQQCDDITKAAFDKMADKCDELGKIQEGLIASLKAAEQRAAEAVARERKRIFSLDEVEFRRQRDSHFIRSEGEGNG